MSQSDQDQIPSAFHAAPFITCAPCHLILPIVTANPIADFIRGRGPTCSNCHKPVDVWASVLEHLDPFGQIGSIPLGPITTHINFDILKHEQTKIKLSDFGIPEGARVLARQYCGHTPNRIFPVEVHGSRPHNTLLPDGTLTLFGTTWPERPDLPDGPRANFTMSVSWIPTGLDVEGWSSLWSALEAFARFDFQGVVVPANIAVELLFDRVVSTHLEALPTISSKHLKGFLGEITYSHRLNVLMPLMVHLSGGPPMQPELKAELNELRTLRNQIGHEGKTASSINKKQAAKLARASIFGFHYAHVIDEHLTAWAHDVEK